MTTAIKQDYIPKTSDKDLNKLLKIAWKQGWKFKATKKHCMAYAPDKSKGMVLIPISSNAAIMSRTYKNIRGEMKKRGLLV